MQKTWDLGSVPGSGGSHGGGHGNPPQFSCLENSMGRGAWWATVCRVGHNWTTHTHTHPHALHSLRTFISIVITSAPPQIISEVREPWCRWSACGFPSFSLVSLNSELAVGSEERSVSPESLFQVQCLPQPYLPHWGGWWTASINRTPVCNGLWVTQHIFSYSFCWKLMQLSVTGGLPVPRVVWNFSFDLPSFCKWNSK